MRSVLVAGAALGLVGCGAAAAPLEEPLAGPLVVRGATVVGRGEVDVKIDRGRVVAVGEVERDPTVAERDLRGRWLVPQVIDSHVHLAYLPVEEALVAGGVAGAVDLASPIGFLGRDHGRLEVVGSGPMITAPGGYPLDSWGEDGYGIACADATAAERAVDDLAAGGARLVKIPLGRAPELAPEALTAAIARAHAHGLLAAVHALTDDAARRAALAGADVLAHTPLEPLAASTLERWRGRVVVSTLAAFPDPGGVAVANLALLRARGARVLYGTDLGNTRAAGISEAELALLGAAGLDGAAVVAAATSAPAAVWGFGELGEIAPGRAARLLVVDADPLLDPTVLARGRPL